MSSFKSKVLNGMDWLSGCFYNAAQQQFDSINYYAQNKSFRDTPWIALHSMGLTAMGVGYGATKFGSWCIDKGCTKENCYKAKCFGKNILERGKNLFRGNTDEVNYVESEVIEDEVLAEYCEGNNLPAPFTQEDWDLAVPPQEFDDTAYSDIDEGYAERLDCTDGEILAVEEEEYPPSQEYIESLFEVDEEEEDGIGSALPSTERSEVPITGGGEAPDPQEDDTPIPFEEDNYIGMPEMEMEIEVVEEDYPEDMFEPCEVASDDETDFTNYFDSENLSDLPDNLPMIDEEESDEDLAAPEDNIPDEKEQALADIYSKYPYITEYDAKKAYDYIWDDERKDYDEAHLYLDLENWGVKYGIRNPHSDYIDFLNKVRG